MSSSRKKLKSKRWIDYALAFSLAFLITILLCFVFIDDVQEGVVVISTLVVEWLIPDLLI